MITYELCVLYRIMPKVELASAIKRTVESIYEKGGILRKLENMGSRDMPYKTSVHGVVYKKANYYLMEFNTPPSSIDQLKDEFGRDVDIIRRRIYKKNEHEDIECTLSEELLPPPYRKSVQDMLQEAKKFEKPKFQQNTGLDYYPFQK